MEVREEYKVATRSGELAELGLNVQIVDVSRLVRWERNYNRHSQEQIEDLAASHERWGQYKSVVGKDVPGTDKVRVYAGEGFWRGLELNRGTRIIVNIRNDLSDAEAEALGVQDNLTPSDDFDYSRLADIVQDEDFPADVPGVDLMAILEMAHVPIKRDAEPQIDNGAELRQEWQTNLGQTWAMGEHTLFIGSAESAGIECAFAVFDPPFNWAWQTQENALSWGIWKTALVMGREKCMPLAVRDDFWHWWVWDAGMNRFGGRGHRPVTGCAMMLLLGAHNWHEESGLAALDRHEIEHFDWPTQVVHIQDHLAGREYKHEKPYPLTDYILSLYSELGDIVGDFFAGSGAFLIACENLKRQYRGAELSPENAAVILDRWARTFEVEPRCL